MSSPETLKFRPVAVENKDNGLLPLYSGDGDQGVLKGDNNTQNLIRSQTVYNRPHTVVHVAHAQFMQQGDDGPDLSMRAAIIEWLKIQPQPDFLTHHQMLLDQVVPGTGKWVLDGEKFRAWIDGSNSSQYFWVHEILGSGKTMLASLIIYTIQKASAGMDGTACIYLYFQDGMDQPDETPQHQQRPTFGNILTNLLIQLLQCQSSDEIGDGLKIKYEDWRSRMIPPTADDCLNMLKDEIALFNKVYLVVDGMDNCLDTSPEKTQDKLQAALRTMPENVQVLVTSRTGLLDSWCLIDDQKLDLKPSRDDVERFVKHRIENDKYLARKINKAKVAEPGFQDKVVRDVADATTGIFLLTKIHMDYLSEQKTLGDVRLALGALPRTVEIAFEKSIQKLKENIKRETKKSGLSLAQHVLTWVVHALNPITVAQVCRSFATRRSSVTFDEDFLPHEVDLRSSCAGLVTIDPKTKVLSLVHESVLNYLRSHDLVPVPADMDLAKMCLKSLLLGEFGNEKDQSLLDYSSMHWFSHFSLGEQHKDTVADDLVIGFLQHDEKVQATFQIIAGKDTAWHNMTGVHAATYLKRPAWIETLINQGSNVNATCSDGRSALHWAAKTGQVDLVAALLQKDAETNIQDRKGDTPLHLALMWSPDEDCHAVVRMLVDAGAQGNIPGGKGHTQLVWAMRYGSLSIAQLLAKEMKDPNVQNEGWSSLREAMARGCDDIVDILLERGADLNCPSSVDGWIPLKEAVQNGDEALVRCLIERKARIDILDEESGESLLQCAVFHRHHSIVRLLLQYGVDVSHVAKDGSTALIKAIFSEEPIVWELLQNGADPNIPDKDGRTALYHAVEKRRRSVAWLLLTKQANPSIRTNEMLSCLDIAVLDNDLSVVWLLCEKGAKTDDAGKDGLTALHWASKAGHLDIVRFLLDKRADTTSKDGNGETALQHAFREKHVEIVELLASRGVGSDLDDRVGYTPLIIATYGRDLQMMRILLKNGASSNFLCKNGTTALHQAVDDRFTEGMQILLQNCTDINVKDGQGYAPLHHAVWFEDEEMANLLLEGGANSDVQDEDLRTPLMHAVQQGFDKQVSILLNSGANPEVKAKNGWTAWEYAGNHQLIQALLQSVGSA